MILKFVKNSAPSAGKKAKPPLEAFSRPSSNKNTRKPVGPGVKSSSPISKIQIKDRKKITYVKSKQILPGSNEGK